MPSFAQNVAQWRSLSILAVTDIVQNANTQFKKNGLRLKCPNFYRLVTSTPFSRFLKNLTPLFCKIKSFFIPSLLNQRDILLWNWLKILNFLVLRLASPRFSILGDKISHSIHTFTVSSLEGDFLMMDFTSSVLARSSLFRLKLFQKSSKVSSLTFESRPITMGKL